MPSPAPAPVVGEHVRPHEDPAVALVDDLDGVPPERDHRLVAPAVEGEDQVVRGTVPDVGDLAHLGLVDPVAGPVDAHDVVELDQHRRGVPGQPPAVGRERSGVGPVREDRHVGPGGEDAGEVVAGGRDGRGVQPGGVDRGVAELVACDERPQEPEVRGEPQDRGVVEGGDERPSGALAVRAAGDDLAEHGVVRRADDAAGLQRRVHPGVRGPAHEGGRAGLRQEPVERVLGVDAGLDGVPAQGQVALGERQRLAGGDQELQPDQVDVLAARPGGPLLGRRAHHHRLGDRVLDLEPGVHLEEVHLAAVVVEEELDGPGVLVADVGGQGDRRLSDRAPYVRADRGRRCLLEDLLVAPLGRAVALEEVHDVAVGVGEHLHLDVPAVLDVLLDQDRVVAERGGGLALRRGDRGVEVTLLVDDAHALAAATGGRLDEHGEPQLARVAGLTGAARDDRHARGDGDLACGVLAPHLFHDRGGRADELEPRGLDGAGELGALGQEAVAGVDGVGVGGLRGGDHLGDVEVAPDPDGVVGLAHVRRLPVEVGVDRDAAQARRAAGPDDAQGDLAAVGDEDGGEHRDHILKMP